MPLVLGPAQVPRFTQIAESERTPELAVLSALAHQSDISEDELRASAGALVTAQTDRASLYFDLLCATFGATLSRAVEDLIMMNGEPLSEWGKKHYWQGKEEGLAEGKEEGKAEGLAKGLAEGEAKGLAEALLRVLEGRGLPISPAQRETLLACADVRLLERWIDGAIGARSVEELIAS